MTPITHAWSVGRSWWWCVVMIFHSIADSNFNKTEIPISILLMHMPATKTDVWRRYNMLRRPMYDRRTTFKTSAAAIAQTRHLIVWEALRTSFLPNRTLATDKLVLYDVANNKQRTHPPTPPTTLSIFSIFSILAILAAIKTKTLPTMDLSQGGCSVQFPTTVGTPPVNTQNAWHNRTRQTPQFNYTVENFPLLQPAPITPQHGTNQLHQDTSLPHYWLRTHLWLTLPNGRSVPYGLSKRYFWHPSLASYPSLSPGKAFSQMKLTKIGTILGTMWSDQIVWNPENDQFFDFKLGSFM
jgi:hypothetical protein